MRGNVGFWKQKLPSPAENQQQTTWKSASSWREFVKCAEEDDECAEEDEALRPWSSPSSPRFSS